MSTGTKIVFWLLLGSISTVLAEGVSNATPYPFFSLWGILVVIPLYTLHTVVLSYFLFRQGRVIFPMLFLAGAIFGLYEAYLTKVVWLPSAFAVDPVLFGIHVLPASLLILFWHPFMAYIFPVFLVENVFTDSSETLCALPQRCRCWLASSSGRMTCLILFSVYCGCAKSFGFTSRGAAFLSGVSNLAVLLVLGWWWLRIKAGRALTFRDLMPSGIEAMILGGLLGGIYLVLGSLILPEALPRTIGPHVAVWVLYALFGTLFYVHVKRAEPVCELPGRSELYGQGLRVGLILGVVIAVLPLLLIPFKVVVVLIMLMTWLTGVILGAAIVVRSSITISANAKSGV